MRILITGSGGFVGGSVGRYAAKCGHQVVGVARRSQPEADWAGEHVSADVAHTDLAPLIARFRPDAVFHAAGTASVGASLAQPLDDFRAAAGTWAHVLDSVRRSGHSPTILFPSSAAVYGNPATLPVREDAPVAPISPYGFHKATAELLAREYATCFGLRIVVCRVFSVLGPRQRRLLAWDVFRQFAGPAPTVELDGTGEETRDYVHVDDLAAAVLGLASLSAGESNPLTVNVAVGIGTSVAKVADLIGSAVGSTKPVRFRGIARRGDPGRWQADTCLLRAALPAWCPRGVARQVGECVDEWSVPPR